MDVNQTIALLASTGACLSAIAAFLAVKQNTKQHKASFMPELALTKTEFIATNNNYSKDKIPFNWVEKENKDTEQKILHNLSIPIKNIGLGTAREVNILWKFNFKDTVLRVNELSQKQLIQAYFEFTNEMLSFKSKDNGNSTSLWINQKSSSLDYILPVSIDSIGVKIQLPDAYIRLMSVLISFSSKGKDFKFIEDIPHLKLSLKFYDIGGNICEENYEIILNISMITNNGESFEGYFDTKKT